VRGDCGVKHKYLSCAAGVRGAPNRFYTCTDLTPRLCSSFSFAYVFPALLSIAEYEAICNVPSLFVCLLLGIVQIMISLHRQNEIRRHSTSAKLTFKYQDEESSKSGSRAITHTSRLPIHSLLDPRSHRQSTTITRAIAHYS
jgi:hypothetical protein